MWLFKQPWFWFLVILDILLYTSYKKIIGMFGEYWVKKELKKLPNDYLIINNVMFKTKDGHTHQIDHIVVSKYGIFVIETKQYDGYIKGNDYDKKWEVHIENKKFLINNPVHQNYGHIQALKELLCVDDVYLISIVCIPSTAKTDISSRVVVGISYLLDRILAFKKEVLPEYMNYYILINNSNIKDRTERRKHIKYAKNKKREKEKNNKNKCPKCGGNLVPREGKYGSFIGCSNYPRCKYTQK